MAVCGLAVLMYNLSRKATGKLDKGFFFLSLWAGAVSLISYVTMVVNDTPDNSYSQYFISMWVWIAAAYFSVSMMKAVHGKISVEIVCSYMIGVALLQCVLAILIHNVYFLYNLSETYVTGEKYMGVGVGRNRLYGVGCALDVGGGRLGAILIMVVYMMIRTLKDNGSKWILTALIASFIFILVCGNMMGRTTTVGALCAIAYLAGFFIFGRKKIQGEYGLYSVVAVLIVVAGVAFCTWIYNTDAEAHKLLRFGFEGFFNYFENGKFETNSTNMLSKGLIFPDNPKTWIIGDGYMAGGANDPYYTGPADYGFYMNTDAGYSRFIFYFGLTGLAIFIGFFICAAMTCARRFPEAGFLFAFLLMLNLLVWIKVSTDLFVIFAPFLCITTDDETDIPHQLSL